MTAQRSISLTPELRNEYRQLFSSCTINEHNAGVVAAAVDAIRDNKARYEAVAGATGVPWCVVGIIHSLEAGLRFDSHLHNGDPLEARTVHVPKRRPPIGQPPFAWEASAIDALGYDGLAGFSDFSLAGTLFVLERYNGFGYRLYHPEVKTPYLWSFSNHYEKGKYGADGKFDPSLVSQQVGAAALLRVLADRGEVELEPRPPVMLLAPAPQAPIYPGRYIRRGERHSGTVLAIQRRLIAVGCGPIDEDGDFGPGTEASVKLFQSRSVNRHGAPLDVDGVVGPDTWEALFGSSSVPSTTSAEQTDALLRKAIDVALSQVGVLEDPPYSNSGERVMAYLASVGLHTPAPWCAAFVYWCFDQAAHELGIENPLVKTGHCLTHWNQAPGVGARRVTAQQATGDPSLVQPGQMFIMDYGEGKGHTGIVERVGGAFLVTVEGNTGPDGSREGLGVFERKQRKISSINVGFIDYASPGQRPSSAPAPEASPTLPDVAPLRLDASTGGLLLRAVKDRTFEPPTWIEIEFAGLLVRVGAHALRASVGGRLLRLPVSYREAIEISNELGWVPPTYELTDQIWSKATLRLPPHSSGEFDPHATQKQHDERARTLRYVVAHDELIEAGISAARRGELTSTEGKDWVVSRRNINAHHKATTYGWHKVDGNPIQPRGPENWAPRHDDVHFDYSQTLRPIQRTATRKSDGAVVDLVDFFEAQGLLAEALAPLRPS